MPKKNFFFYLILQEFCDFSGTWDLHYLVFLRMQFLSGKLGPKMDQNCKLWVHFISAKTQNFEGFFRHCVSLTGRLTLFKISAKSNNICGTKGSKAPPPLLLLPPLPKKGAISWMLNQYEKLRTFLTSQPQMLFWRNLLQIYIWIRSFIWQNLEA